MSGNSGGTGRFSPEQRELLERTITAELRRLWDEAVAAGVPAEALAEVIEQRRQAILSALGGSAGGADDGKNGGHDTVDDGRIGH